MELRSHYVATGYIYDHSTDTFLLVQHKKLGKWLAPGGHLNEGEQPHQGALREVLEEIGIEGRISTILAPPPVGTATVAQLPTPFCILYEPIPTKPPNEEHMHIDFVYAIEIDPSRTLHLAAQEVTRANWFSVEEIDRLDTYENVKRVCRAISESSRSQPAPPDLSVPHGASIPD